MFDSFEGESDAEGGPGFSVFWRGGEADYEPWRFDVERPWALHETPVSGDRDGYASPDAPPEQAVWARKMIPIMLADLTPRQRFVMELHWDVGARANRPHTFEEIAGYMGVTKQAVHRLHGRAMKNLHSRWVD